MTARTLPITPRVGLSLVHQPTSRPRVPTAPTSTVTLLQRMLAWLGVGAPLRIHWEERDRLRQSGFPLYVDSYTWLPGPHLPGRRDAW